LTFDEFPFPFATLLLLVLLGGVTVPGCVVSSNGGVIIAARAVSWEAFMAERVDSRVLMSSDSVVVGAMLAAFDLSRLVAKSRSLWF
jgi:hypothetical protein